jgi:uncharacterized protein (AIM24 family)
MEFFRDDEPAVAPWPAAGGAGRQQAPPPPPVAEPQAPQAGEEPAVGDQEQQTEFILLGGSSAPPSSALSSGSSGVSWAQVLQVNLAPGDEIISDRRFFLYSGGRVRLKPPAQPTWQARFARAIGAGVPVFQPQVWANESRTSRGYVGLSSSVPGRIVPLNLGELGPLYVASDCLLCSSKRNELQPQQEENPRSASFVGIHFQKVTGAGMAFMSSIGLALQRRLREGETLRVQSGVILGYTEGCKLSAAGIGGSDSQAWAAPGWRRAHHATMGSLGGGGGILPPYVSVTGPGTVFMQSAGRNAMAERLWMGLGQRAATAPDGLAPLVRGGGLSSPAAALPLTLFLTAFFMTFIATLVTIIGLLAIDDEEALDGFGEL